MKEDLSLLKEGTEVVLDNGIKTTIVSNQLLVSNISNKWEEDDEKVDTLFSDEYGDDYAILDLTKLSENDIDWENDSVFVDESKCKCNDHGDVYLTDIDIPQDILSLDRDSLISLRQQIVLGSLYLSDYNNDCFVDREVVSQYADAFLNTQREKFGEKMDEHLSGEEFADYILQEAQ